MHGFKVFLIDSKIIDLRLIRGLGIIPSRFELEILKGNIIYIIETEINFRIIYKNSLLVCFDDLFLDNNYKEISLKKYRTQEDIEKTLLFKNLNSATNKIINKKIKNILIKKYGDVEIILSNFCKIQIINDTHLFDSSILRLITKEKKKSFTSKNGSTYLIPDTLFEIKNGNYGEIITNNCFSNKV